jgi:hypothetical protein
MMTTPAIPDLVGGKHGKRLKPDLLTIVPLSELTSDNAKALDERNDVYLGREDRDQPDDRQRHDGEGPRAPLQPKRKPCHEERQHDAHDPHS